jgi:hypothetical protein
MSVWRRFVRFFNAETIILDNKDAWKTIVFKVRRVMKDFSALWSGICVAPAPHGAAIFTLSSHAHSFDDTAGLALSDQHLCRGSGATDEREKA